MEYCKIKNPPEYAEAVERWTRESDADGDAMGKVIEELVNNDNYLKKQLETLTRPVELTLPASGWSAAAPYTQSVNVPGLKESDKIQIMSAVTKSTPAAISEAWEKMAAMVKAGEALDGQAVFYCPKKKPTQDFNIKLLGVSADE